MRVLVCRPEKKGCELVEKLRLANIDAFHTPLIDIQLGADLANLSNALTELSQEPDSGLVFLFSPNVFKYQEVSNSPDDLKGFGNKNIIWPASLSYFAIGRSTANRFNEVSQLNAYYPEGREISENLIQHPKLNSLINSGVCKKALILRGNDGRDFTYNWLVERGIKVTVLECYKRNLISIENSRLLDNLDYCATSMNQANNLNTKNLIANNLIIATSGEMLAHLAESTLNRQKSEEINTLFHSTVVVVSHRLANIAKQLGWHSIEVADNADNQSLYNKITEIISLTGI